MAKRARSPSPDANTPDGKEETEAGRLVKRARPLAEEVAVDAWPEGTALLPEMLMEIFLRLDDANFIHTVIGRLCRYAHRHAAEWVRTLNIHPPYAGFGSGQRLVEWASREDGIRRYKNLESLRICSSGQAVSALLSALNRRAHPALRELTLVTNSEWNGVSFVPFPATDSMQPAFKALCGPEGVAAQLTHLDMSNSQMLELLHTAFVTSVSSRSFGNLRELTLACAHEECMFLDVVVRAVAPTLETLSLELRPTTMRQPWPLHLGVLTRLHTLSLRDARTVDTGRRGNVKSLPPGLRTLALDMDSWEDHQAFGACISACARLETLRLRGDGFAAIRFEQLTALHTLVLQGAADVSVSAVGKAPALRHFTMRSFSSAVVDPRALPPLTTLALDAVRLVGDMATQTALQTLKLRNVYAVDGVVTTQLRTLGLWNSSLGAPSLVAVLAQQTALRDLTLHSVSLDGDGTAALAPLRQLERISLRRVDGFTNDAFRGKPALRSLEFFDAVRTVDTSLLDGVPKLDHLVLCWTMCRTASLQAVDSEFRQRALRPGGHFQLHHPPDYY